MTPQENDELNALQEKRTKLVEELQGIQVQLADRNSVDVSGRRLAPRVYWKERAGLIARQAQIQSSMPTLNKRIRDLSQSMNAKKGGRNSDATKLIRRLVSIIDRLGGAVLSDIEADIVDEATEFLDKFSEDT